GTQYRSAIYVADADEAARADASREMYQEQLTAAGFGPITTEIAPAGLFFFAEEYHQQYLDKNPHGYNCSNGTGVACPIGVGVKAEGPTA
ncbi:MAG TPA: peptide-methionine (S)-S-oxide reductase, partial [Candidatus Limnocylindrales bacterium]